MLANVFTKTVHDRWRGVAIGTLVLGALLIFGMAVYRDIDISVYTRFPEAFRALVNIPAEADVGGLAYGAIYSSYGALTLAALAIAMGSASIAGEERKGTIGLLLANPDSRTRVLAAKASSMVLLIALGATVMWAAGRLAPILLDVDVTGLHVGALSIHLFANALFYGFMAMAIGAWTGRGGLATGATSAVMVISFFAVGLLPLVSGLAGLAKAFPWYYLSGSQPVNNGISWVHVGVLLGGSALLAGAALGGVNRRDLRSRSVGVSMLDRLRANPLTKQVGDRLAGSARVSAIWIKTASEHQGLVFITAITMFLVMGVVLGPFYSVLDETFMEFSDQLPETLLALFGGGDLSTPEGFYQLETFGLMAPLAVIVVAVTIGAGGLAGEEAHRTMGLLLANPIPRRTVVAHKTAAMVVLTLVVGAATAAGVIVGSVIGGLGMSPVNIIATSLLASLLGLVFGALALAVSAATGLVRAAVVSTVAAALVLYVLNAFLPLSAGLAGYARWTPFHYYLSSDPLNAGMNWEHGALLAGLAAGLVALAVVLFDRRDLRQTG